MQLFYDKSHHSEDCCINNAGNQLQLISMRVNNSAHAHLNASQRLLASLELVSFPKTIAKTNDASFTKLPCAKGFIFLILLPPA